MKLRIAVVVILSCICSASFAQWIDGPKETEENEKFDKPERYFEWFYGQRAFGLGYIPKDGRLKALQQRDAMRKSFLQSRKQIPQETGTGESQQFQKGENLFCCIFFSLPLKGGKIN